MRRTDCRPGQKLNFEDDNKLSLTAAFMSESFGYRIRRRPMATVISREDVTDMVKERTQLVEALPAREYEQAHLPGRGTSR
jgi:hypothetical protein